MAQYRTAQGKFIDMGIFTAQHERVRAVGNMKVNARGDTIDSHGRVVQSVNDKINEYYTATVTNPGATNSFANMPADAIHRPQMTQSKKSAASKPAFEELSEEERQLQESLDGSEAEEQLIEQQKVKTTKGKR